MMDAAILELLTRLVTMAESALIFAASLTTIPFIIAGLVIAGRVIATEAVRERKD